MFLTHLDVQTKLNCIYRNCMKNKDSCNLSKELHSTPEQVRIQSPPICPQGTHFENFSQGEKVIESRIEAW